MHFHKNIEHSALAKTSSEKRRGSLLEYLSQSFLFLIFLHKVTLNALVYLEHIKLLGLIPRNIIRLVLFRHKVKHGLFIFRIGIAYKMFAFAFNNVNQLQFTVSGLLCCYEV